MKKDTCINPNAGRLTRAENDNRTRKIVLLILLGMTILAEENGFRRRVFHCPCVAAIAGIHAVFIKTARVFCIVGRVAFPGNNLSNSMRLPGNGPGKNIPICGGFRNHSGAVDIAIMQIATVLFARQESKRKGRPPAGNGTSCVVPMTPFPPEWLIFYN